MTEPREPDTAPDVENDPVVEPTEAPAIVINTPSVTVNEDDDTEDPD